MKWGASAKAFPESQAHYSDLGKVCPRFVAHYSDPGKVHKRVPVFGQTSAPRA